MTQELNKAGEWLVVCLCADWCGTCKQYRQPFEQLAASSPERATAQGAPVVAVADADGQQVMIRDPRLGELLAAHKQFGSTSALQMPAGFLRNATFETPGR